MMRITRNGLLAAFLAIAMTGCSQRPAPVIYVPPEPTPVQPPQPELTPEQLYADYTDLVPDSKIYALPTWELFSERDLYFYRGVNQPELLPAIMDSAMATVQPLFTKPLQRPFLFFTIVVPPDEPETSTTWDCFYADGVGDIASGHQCVTGDAYTNEWPHRVFVVDWQSRPKGQWYGLLQHEYQHLIWFNNDQISRCQLPSGELVRLFVAVGHGGPCDPLALGKMPPLFVFSPVLFQEETI